MSYAIDEQELQRRREELYHRMLAEQQRGVAAGLFGAGNMGIQQAQQAFNHDRSVAALPDKKPQKLLLLL